MKTTDLHSEPAMTSFVQALRELSFVEASYWLSTAYAKLLDGGYRKQLAMFFTPASLTKGLLDDLEAQGVDFAKQAFFDPACGGAAFLAPIAMRMRQALRKKGSTSRQILNHIEVSLYGTDLDATLCALSKCFLRMALHEDIVTAGYQPDFKVHQADSLVDIKEMYHTIDVVVCNPPYRKLSSDEVEPLREGFGSIIEAQPNLYGIFIGLCVELLRDGGRAALVTPTSFLSGQYFTRLRAFLAEKTDIEHIGMVSDRNGVFIDVEQETALTVIRRRNGKATRNNQTRVSVVSGTGEYKAVGLCELKGEGALWPIPRSVDDVRLLREAGRTGFTLDDYGYRVRIGAYVWNRDERPKYESIVDVKRAKAKSAMPLLWSRDISTDGHVHFDGHHMTEDSHRFVDLGDKRHRSVVTQPSVVLQRVTSNDQPRRLVAAAVPDHIYDTFGGFVGENHVVILEPIVGEPALDATALASLLGTTPVDRNFRCISGATNVSAYELRQLSLPNPNLLTKYLNNGLPMEDAVSRAYGLRAGTR